MVSLTCDADHRDGVTLVTVRLDGAGVAQRVRLTNRLDGPVWPPRRRGVPAEGWNDDCFETVVPADGSSPSATPHLHRRSTRRSPSSTAKSSTRARSESR